MRRHRLSLLLTSLLLGTAHVPLVSAADAKPDWQAGAASVVITPHASMWMAGYAARTKPSEGKVQDLFAKALVLQDNTGARLVIVTADLIGIPRELRESLEPKLRERYQLPPAAVLLNASHTHCGPELRAAKAEFIPLDAARVAQSRDYLEALEQKLIDLVGRALDDLKPARLHYSHARAGFAMNRRLPTESGYANSPNPDGPVDHDVPVLSVRGDDGRLRAVLFGYACHNTTLSFNQFCGDYAGYAQEYLEAAHPGATALFLTGCGGDQNPYPRRELKHAQQHGRALANAVETALEVKSQRTLRGPLRLAMEDVTLDFAPLPAREELLKQKESGDRYDRRKAEYLLGLLDAGQPPSLQYPYPVHVIRLGDDLTLVALAGEVVVDYSLRLKREIDSPIVWVAGYSNDVFGYVPSLRVLKEGGYEAGGAMRFGPLPGPFTETIEERIVGKVHEMIVPDSDDAKAK